MFALSVYICIYIYTFIRIYIQYTYKTYKDIYNFLNRKLTHAPILRYILDGGVEGSGESGESGK